MLLTDIKPNDKNPRTISKEDLEKLKSSIKELPKMMRLRPIVVDKDNVIVGGNMRYRAIEALGMKEIPDDWVAKADDFTEEEIRRFVIQDNVSGGEWDWEELANQYDPVELEDWGLELPDSLKPEEEVEEDEAPEVDESETPNGMYLDADWSDIKQKKDVDFGKRESKKYDNVIGDHEDYDPSHILNHFSEVDEIFLWGADYYAERIAGKNNGSWFVWDKRLNEESDRMYGSGFELCWSKVKHKRDLVRVKWAEAYL